jgi:hypothetical protein
MISKDVWHNGRGLMDECEGYRSVNNTTYRLFGFVSIRQIFSNILLFFKKYVADGAHILPEIKLRILSRLGLISKYLHYTNSGQGKLI